MYPYDDEKREENGNAVPPPETDNADTPEINTPTEAENAQVPAEDTAEQTGHTEFTEQPAPLPQELQYTPPPVQYPPPQEPQYYAPPAYNPPPPQEPQYAPPSVYYTQQVPQYTPPPVYYQTPQEPQYAPPPVYSRPQEAEIIAPPVQKPPADTSHSMYSPGICVEQPAPKSRNNDISSAKPRRESKITVGSFFRAACLVIVCTLFSALASTLVINYRIDSGDLASAPTQVVLGNAPATPPPQPQPQDDSIIAALPVEAPDTEMSAQDIYDMATSQTVGISVTPSDVPNAYGMQGSEPTVIGSGFIISADGYILTNYHVVEVAHELGIPISVVFFDGSSYEAQVVGFEASSDVAVLKINQDGLNPAFIGNSDNLRVGQSVYAVGNPFGDLVYTMTDGIVSAIDRVVSVDGKTISTFQFSAAVNSGNSGGPVYNTKGEVIGIVTAKVSRGNVEGIGFAIPINDAIYIASALIEHGYISGRPQLGVTVHDVSQAHADYFGWVVGVYIRGVNPGSAAEKAGIQVGDIITAINETEVDSLEAMRFALRQFSAGDTTVITVWRDGETINLTITFDEDMNAGKPEQPPLQLPDNDVDPFRFP